MAAFSSGRRGWVVVGLVAGTLGVGMAAAGSAPAADTASLPAGFFGAEVRPLLQRSCLGCHGAGARLSGLDLRSREAALKGGTRGPALVPGSAARSLLYQFVTGARTPVMPPGGKLPAADVARLEQWLDGGAPWEDARIEGAAKQVWWSFRAPALPMVPAVVGTAPSEPPNGSKSKSKSRSKSRTTARPTRPAPKADPWVKNPIDAFVLAELRRAGLEPSPPAERRVLIRRAYLDMIGLPPAPEEVRAFEVDRSPVAWERVVDRLLASPQYGERWGRHWLDLVRYADSSGFEGDKDRPLAWRYRDWIIRAFNEDMPYDAFIREQLAGDEVKPGDAQALIATGYLACGPQDQVEKNEKTRADELDDLVSTTGSVFLGLTVGCARCHDHKYDPIKQTDYYRLQALFAPSERREVEVALPERQAAQVRNAEIEKELRPLRDEAAGLRQRGTAAVKAAGKVQPKEEEIAAALPEPERKRLAELAAAIKAGEGRKAELPKALVVTDRGREWGPVHLLVRGDAYHKGPEVQPGFIASLPGGDAVVAPAAATPQSTGRRRALADWIAGPQNPLTARVWMNRVWQHHFGHGLVGTPSNFGINGELPSHPGLLDWLAVRFAQGSGTQRVPGVQGLVRTPNAERRTPNAVGSALNPEPRTLTAEAWRLKPIHRLILLSNTYRQSSKWRAEGARVDPQGRLLWRMPVRRLEAEAIRDSMLAAAGTLNPEMGGPPVYPPVDPSLRADTFLGFNWPVGEDSAKTWRRSVYVKVKRSLLLPQLEVFDCPEITASVAQRNVTTTPTQALMLLNDPLILRQARLFAERVEREAGKEPRRQVERAYRLALGREPTAAELRLSLDFLARRAAEAGTSPLADLCHSLFNLNEFVYVP